MSKCGIREDVVILRQGEVWLLPRGGTLCSLCVRSGPLVTKILCIKVLLLATAKHCLLKGVRAQLCQQPAVSSVTAAASVSAFTLLVLLILRAWL